MKTRLFFIVLLAQFMILPGYTLYAHEITVASPGDLINQIDLNSASEIQNLTLHGEINSTDIRVINRLTNMETLNLSDTRIVSGGGAYLEQYATEDDVIGNRMFQSCTNLTSISLPSSIVIIRDYAFYQMSKLEEVKIPNSVTSIGTFAFSGCSSITSITLPEKLESLGGDAFEYCLNLQSITFQGGIIITGLHSFLYCNKLKEVHINDLSSWCCSSFYAVGSSRDNYSNPLSYAHHLYLNEEEVTNLVIPEDVQNVKAYSFLDCLGLTTIRINDHVKSIGAYTFSGCSNVTDIYVYSLEPPTIKSTTFDNTLTQTATLHVPKGFKNNFWLADYWSNFTKIVDDLDIKCQLVYKVDGQEYLSKTVMCGATIEAIVSPEKEGYTFAGWFQENGDTIPDVMPAHDITVMAKFIPNSYKLTYIIDDFSKSSDVPFSAKITSLLSEDSLITDVAQFSSPMSDAKEGNFYSLIGKLDECPEDQHPNDDYWHSDWHNGNPPQGSHYFQVEMPDGYDRVYGYLYFQFTRRNTPNEHTTEWSVRGTNDFNAEKEDCEELLYAYTPFTSQTETIKSNPFAHKGYKYLRFYSESQYTIRQYKGFFHLSRFQLYPVASINKEGHTFDGWFQENGDTIPEIMPAHDVTVKAKFTPNTYRVIYVVDERVYKVDSVVFATKILAEKDPEKEGYTFSGWSEIPDSMPANDVTITGKFTINSYKLTYMVDEKEYKSFDIKFGSTIIAEEELKKEGYTFSGWSEIPETMPAKDVIITGSFKINKYLMTYMLDDLIYKTDSIAYGTKLTAEAAPEKEGYSFSGWSEIPDSMPAKDVTITGKFTINTYILTYMIDGEEYKSFNIKYGSTIIAETEPNKEGYTFSGWSEIPDEMPAKDVTVTGSFTVNKYLMTYMLDDLVYKTDSIAYGTKLTAETEPEKEGYSFSGWSEIPETMPAKDVIVTGKFTINTYKLTYLLNGEVYKSDSIVYGTPLSAEPAIEREGYTFSGWSEVPATMPAKDVTITATLKVNTYTITYFVDDYEYKVLRVEYGTVLTAEEAPEKEGYTFSGWSEIPETMPAKDVVITGTFSINSYTLTYEVDGEEYKTYTLLFASTIIPISDPTKEGYTFSGWSEIPAEMPAHDVTITGTFTVNKYKVRYYDGDKLIAEDEVEYGAEVVLRDYTPEDATRYTFIGWDGEKYETMPAHDIEYHANIADGVSRLAGVPDGVEAIYDANGRKLSKMQRGVNIILMNDGTKRKVIVK